MLNTFEIEDRFGFHRATTDGENPTLPKHKELRVLFKLLAMGLNDILPDGRAKSVALTELESASMWAHKSISSMSPLMDESFNVHNHGPGEGLGLDCQEVVVDGLLKGACLRGTD